jgi:hypothetical protein
LSKTTTLSARAGASVHDNKEAMQDAAAAHCQSAGAVYVLALVLLLVLAVMAAIARPLLFKAATLADRRQTACAVVCLVWPGGTQVTLPTWLQFRNMLRSSGLGLQLQALRMHSVGFTGPIGNLDYYFPALRMLDLSGNAFVGPLPSVTTTGWLYLDVSNQMLSGGQRACCIVVVAATWAVPSIEREPRCNGQPYQW